MSEMESAAERAMQKAHDAVADLKVAIWTCKTRPQLAELRTNIEALIEQLEATSSVALTCDEHFGDNR